MNLAAFTGTLAAAVSAEFGWDHMWNISVDNNTVELKVMPNGLGMSLPGYAWLRDGVENHYDEIKDSIPQAMTNIREQLNALEKEDEKSTRGDAPSEPESRFKDFGDI